MGGSAPFGVLKYLPGRSLPSECIFSSVWYRRGNRFIENWTLIHISLPVEKAWQVDTVAVKYQCGIDFI